MKNIFWKLSVVGILLVLAGCGNRTERRIKDLVVESIKSKLYYPESYDEASFRCDSLFVQVFTRENLRKSAKIMDLVDEIKRIDNEVVYDDIAVAEVACIGDMSGHGMGNSYLSNDTARREKLLEKITLLFDEIVDEYYMEPEFCGFYVILTYRAENNAGGVAMGENVYILDKEGTRILETFDLMDNDVLQYLQMIDLIAYELGEEYTEEDIIDLCKNIKSKRELIMNS